jgi:2-oxoglutarate ferredoxin oxidoreductase subunit beta
VTFNDHVGSTKSYAYTREHMHHTSETGFVPPATEITADYAEGTAVRVSLHDGSSIVLKKADADYDPTNRSKTLRYLEKHRNKGEIPTGLLFIDDDLPDMHTIAGTAKKPLRDFAYSELTPGSAALEKLQRSMR